MSRDWEDSERPRGYYICLAFSIVPILSLFFLPLFSSGFDQLPWALLMSAFVILPLLSCGFEFRGRPLFQFSYHGTPFVEEVMNPVEDEQID